MPHAVLQRQRGDVCRRSGRQRLRATLWRLSAVYDPVSQQQNFDKMSAPSWPKRVVQDKEISSAIGVREAKERKFNLRTKSRLLEDFKVQIRLKFLSTKLEEEFCLVIIDDNTAYSTLRLRIWTMHTVSKR